MNTFYRFTETWLKHYDDGKLWHLQSECFATFRLNSKSSQKSKGGGVLLVIPKSFNPRLRIDLNYLSQEFFGMRLV